VPAGRPFRAPDPPAPRVLNARLTKEVDASTCEQSHGFQSLVGIVVGEKNRCVRIGVAEAPRGAIPRAGYESWQGQFQGQFGPEQCSRNSKPVVYLAFSRGEVAERLKAAVC
jgi:hypothetical protein